MEDRLGEGEGAGSGDCFMNQQLFHYSLMMFPAVLTSFLVAVSTLTVTVEPTQTLSAPRGAQHVAMMRVHLRADCAGDIPVEELRLARRGLGFSSDIIGVYAESQGLRVSNVAVVQRSGSIDLRLRDLIIPACGKEDLTVYMDLSAEADVAAEHRLALRGNDAILASGAQVMLQTSAPFSDRRTVHTAGDSVGSVVVEYLRLLNPVRYGDRRIIARLRFSAMGLHDQEITRITFTNAGSARSGDLRNLVLGDSHGQRLSAVVDHLQEDRVVLLLDPPLRISRNGTRTVELTADVRASNRRTLQFLIEEPGDIVSAEVRGRSSR